MQKFLSELQRRKVLRVASGYVVAGWVILQVALSLQAAMKLPDWFSTVIVSLLIIGFPIAVVVSWFFEFTPDGIKRTAPSTEAARFQPQTADFALAAALALVLAAVGVQLTTPQTPATPVAAAPKTEPEAPAASIAVLPFADLSPAKDQEYFSDGMAEEVLNVLARTDGLRVASRTSSFQYRKSTLALPAIAKALGVRHILEGSVRKAGDTVRITAQLIDATTDAHLWSQTFDRPLSTATVFAIQDEIATAVVGHFKSAVASNSTAAPRIARAADTSSVSAYDLYLKGAALFTARGKANLAEAAHVLERATVLDPKFARAWAMLATVYVILPDWGVTDREYIDLGLEATTTALALDPNLSMPYAARALMATKRVPLGTKDTWEDALSNFDAAIERDPKNATAWLWRGVALFQLGYFDRALQDMARCNEIDPAYENCRRWTAIVRLSQGRTDEALQIFEAGLANGFFNRNPTFAAAYAKRGNRQAALALLAQTYADTPRLIDPLYRTLTNPSFRGAELKAARDLIESDLKAANYQADARLLLRDYAHIPIAGWGNGDSIWWDSNDAEFVKSPERKAIIRSWRLPGYWRKHGFPPQCKPVGADDFECN